jgi:hypothetical protein
MGANSKNSKIGLRDRLNGVVERLKDKFCPNLNNNKTKSKE